MSSAGFQRHGLACTSCGLPFALSLGAGVFSEKDLEKLEDPFSAKCPLCGQQSEYSKGDIQMLYSTGS